MSFGIEIRNSTNDITLGMDNFTLSKIYSGIVPGLGPSHQAGVRTDSYNISIPGFTAESCVVIITPVVFESTFYKYTPTYIEVSPGVIGIIRYWQGVGWDLNNDPYSVWRANSPDCRVEVYRVLQ